MIWNPQYEIVALIMTALFMVFYHFQRSLPMLKNIYFGYLIRVELLCIISDLIACYISDRFTKMPVWLLMFSNTLYFTAMLLLFYFFYIYSRVTARERAKVAYKRWTLLKIPFFIAAFVLFINIFTGIYFTVDNTVGFQRGRYYYILTFLYITFYIVIGLLFVIKYQKSIPKKEKLSILTTYILIILGTIIFIWFKPDVLLVNGAASLGIGIMYLAMQNPEYDIDQTSRVYNRAGFERFVSERIRMKRPMKCIVVGFSNFSNIRSIYGEKKTDILLNRIGIRIRNGLKNVIPFYMHHGRFLLIIKENDDIEPIIEFLSNYFSKNFVLDNDKVQFQLRIAYAYIDPKRDNVNDVEEALLYSIKEAEKADISDILFVDDDVYEKLNKIKTIRAIFHEALKNDGLSVYYQPIFDRDSGSFITAEALVRIEHPELGIIYPDSFISIAEEDGSILRLGAQVFKKVCRFISTHNMDALGLKYIEINLSPIQCMHKGLAEELIMTAGEYGVDMSRFNFEITETAMMDTNDLKRMMNVLIASGASFSLDDYGTGFSNLINILALPFHIVKIDKSIIWSYFKDSDYILPRLTDMFIGDDLEIVAEGAETKEMTEELQDLGCRFIQGYYYSKPVSEERFVEFLKRSNS